MYLKVCEWYCEHFQERFFFKQKALQDISVLGGFNKADTVLFLFVTKSLSSLKRKLAKKLDERNDTNLWLYIKYEATASRKLL